jgi:uncharacterized protein (UPF0332 family)
MTTSLNTPFNPDEFFSLAGSIIRDQSSNDAALRTAISRAYYSVFLTARDALFGIDELGSTQALKDNIAKKHKLRYGYRSKHPHLAVHQRVIFSVLDKTNNVTLHQQLEQLKEARVLADYIRSDTCLTSVGKHSWREYAEETMELASLVLPMTKMLPRY